MRGRIETVADAGGRSRHARHCRLLVIDDDYQIRQLFRDIFQDRNVTVLCASDVDDACRHFHGLPIDLAVIDVVLPGRSGIEFGTMLSVQRIPVLLMSGHPEAIAACISAGHALLQKPFGLRDLIGAVAESLPCHAFEPASSGASVQCPDREIRPASLPRSYRRKPVSMAKMGPGFRRNAESEKSRITESGH